MKIVTFCGSGMGSSAILKINADRVLQRLGLDARVVATDLAGLAAAAEDAQVILTSPELAHHIGTTYADVVIIENYLDLSEITAKLESAIG
jgi:PTS system ascorbate-specific IIB component